MHPPYLVRTKNFPDYYYIKANFSSLVETNAKSGLKEGCFCNYHSLLVQNLELK